MYAQLSAISKRFRPAACCFGHCLQFLIVVALLVGSRLSHGSVTNQFIRLTTFPSGGTPQAAASADFNRDGKADMAVLNSNGVLSILHGTGSGTFAAEKAIATISPVPARFLFAADFNGDSNQDLLVLDNSGNAITIYPGHGDGSFGSPHKISAGLTGAGSIAIGDFNGDVRPDVVVANDSSVSVLLGKPGGYFQAPVVTITGLSGFIPLTLALGDVNRDGNLDVVVSDEGFFLQVLLGSGHATFNLRPVFSFDFTFAQTALAIADFDLDGKPDLATAMGTVIDAFVPGEMCISSGNGDGTFNQSSGGCFRAPDDFSQMVVTDLNGNPGVVFDSDPFYVLTTSAPGKFSESRYAAGGGPVALGDFNGDHKQDVVAANDHGVQVLLNPAGGLLRAPTDVVLSNDPHPSIISMNATDFNGDGFADLAVEQEVNLGFKNVWMAFIGSLLGAPANRMDATGDMFVYSPFDNNEAMTYPLAIGDFNHDGHVDIAYASVFTGFEGEHASVMQVLFGDGLGHFPNLGPQLGLTTNFIAAGYFNSDGFADLASLDGSGLEILLGKGDGTFASPVTYPVGANPVFVLQRDLNHDGKRDLVVVNQDSDDISVLLGKGDGTFKPQRTFAAGTLPKWAVTGDFNRDGKIDIAVAGSKGISVLLGNGDGTFLPEKAYLATGPVTGIVQASVRQDGNECLLAIDSVSQRFVLLPGVGNGTFGAPVFFPVDRVPKAIVAGDFNRDGATDIAIQSDGGVVVFYNQGGNYVSLSSSSTMPKANNAVKLTARVTPGWGEIATVSGNMTFKDGTKVLGTAGLQGRTATITTSLPAGTHHIVASYGGNAALNPNHSPALTVVAQ